MKVVLLVVQHAQKVKLKIVPMTIVILTHGLVMATVMGQLKLTVRTYAALI